jgi:diamine N-acetyltransferase
VPAVTLREITADTVRAVCALEVSPDQRSFVAANALSIAEACFEPKAWFRAVYADETPVGFVMLYLDREKQEYYLWRLMIDARHQGESYGRRALDLVVDHIRTLPGARYLYSSYVDGERSPGRFYARYGFEETGELEDGERVIRLSLVDR